METALNLASIIFVLTLLFGLGILVSLVWSYLMRDRYVIRLDQAVPVPSAAMDTACDALESLKQTYFQAVGDRRNQLGHRVKRLQMRIDYLQQCITEDQYTYSMLTRQRERVWRDWKIAFDRMNETPFRERTPLRQQVAEAIRRYHRAHKLVNEEWRRVIARDSLRLGELRSQGVLDTGIDDPQQEYLQRGSKQGGEAALNPETAEGNQAPLANAPQGSPGDNGTKVDQEATGQAIDAAVDEAMAARDSATGNGATGNGTPRDGADGTANPLPEASETPAARLAAVRSSLVLWGAPVLGEIGQAEILDPTMPKSARGYRDPTLSLGSLPGGRLVGADLSRSNFSGVHFLGSQTQARCAWTGADLRRIQLRRASPPHQFVECDFSGAHFGESTLEHVLFLRCTLASSLWRGAQLNGVKFSDCTLAGADWDDVDLSRTVFAGSTPPPSTLSEPVRPSQREAPPAAVAPAPTQETPAPRGTTASTPNTPSSPTPAPAQASTPDTSNSGQMATSLMGASAGQDTARSHTSSATGSTARSSTTSNQEPS